MASAATAASASNLTNFRILFLRFLTIRYPLQASLVFQRLEHEHQVPLEQPRIRRRRQRRGTHHRRFDRLPHGCIAVALVDLHRQHRAGRSLRHAHPAFEPGPGRRRAIPVANDALLDHRNVLVQQPGILRLRPALLLLDLIAQLRLALLLQARVFRGLAALGFFLLLAFDLGYAFAFRLDLTLPIRVCLRLRLGLTLRILALALLLLFDLASLLLVLALLLLLLTLLLGSLFRLASLLLLALLRLLALTLLYALALLLSRRALDGGPVDHHCLDRQYGGLRLARELDHGQAEDGRKHGVQQQRADEVNPVIAQELRHARSALGPLGFRGIGDEADFL